MGSSKKEALNFAVALLFYSHGPERKEPIVSCLCAVMKRLGCQTNSVRDTHALNRITTTRIFEK